MRTRSLRQDGRPKSPGGHDRPGAGGAARRAGPVRDRKLRPLLAAAGLALATAAPVGSAAAATLVVDKSNPACTDKGTGARLLHDRRRRRQDQPRRHRPGQGRHLQREGRHQALGRRGRGRHLRRRPRRHRHGPDRRLRPRERAVGHGAGVRGGRHGVGLQHHLLRPARAAVLELHPRQQPGRNSAGYGIYVGNSSAFTLSGNTVTGSTNYGVYLTGDTGFTLSGGEVSTSGQPVSGSTRQGISGTGSGTGLITGVTVDRNTDSGIFLAERDERGHGQGQHRVRQRARLHPRRAGDRGAGHLGQPDRGQRQLQQRGLRDPVLHRRQRQRRRRQRPLQQRRPRHRRPGLAAADVRRQQRVPQRDGGHQRRGQLERRLGRRGDREQRQRGQRAEQPAHAAATSGSIRTRTATSS